jgi:hypothetical protein
MPIKTKFFNNLCLKNGFCTPLLEVLWCMFTLRLLFLRCLQWGLNFLNINPHCSNYSLLSANFSALLPTAQKNDQHYCQQQRSLFCVVAYNTRKCSNFSLFVFSALLSVMLIIFSAFWTTEQKNDQRYCLHSGKIVGVVDNKVVKCLNLNISTNSKPYANLH